MKAKTRKFFIERISTEIVEEKQVVVKKFIRVK